MPKTSSNPIQIEDIARRPLPGTAIPTSIAFSPDDRFVTYLRSPDFSLRNELYFFDIQAQVESPAAPILRGELTEENVSPEEALRRERQRQLTTGVTAYAWAEKASRILIPTRDGLYLLDDLSGKPRLLLETRDQPAIDPQLSPDGRWVAYVSGGELYVLSCEAGGEPRRLTSGASETLTHGLAEFVAQEEMARSHGFWWSPDSSQLAFEEADTSAIPLFQINHSGKDETGPSAQEVHRYPFAGEPNARVRLGVISRDGGEPAWMDLAGAEEDFYLARVTWMPGGALTAQILNRAQDALDLVSFDLRTGSRHILLRETSATWVNLHDLFWPLENGGFLWGSERTGFMHLYLYDGDGALVRPLTSGEWLVDALCGVDETAGRVYFTAGRENPTESQLYSASFSGEAPQRITHEAGFHSVIVDHACKVGMDTYQSTRQPPVVRLCSLADGAVLQTIFANPDPRLDQLDLRAPEIVSLQNRHGDLLYGAIYRPPARFGDGPHPCIVTLYGGPHGQLVQDYWGLTANLRAQYLASLGYFVFILDNRGMDRRGLAFESAIYHHMGSVEVDDQVDGVHWLVEKGWIDPARVGIYGWSYGGYMSAMCLLRAPEVFKAAVAGAPVSSMDGYDTCYTERYMGTPQNNPQGYRDSSLIAYAGQLEGKLMIVHGLIDENVHFRNTARLIEALIRADKDYELLLLPNGRHSIRDDQTRIYMERRIRDFFLRELGEPGRASA